MSAKHAPVGSFLTIGTEQLQALMDVLKAAGYRTIGPRLMDSAIVFGDLDKIEQLPVGYLDRQDGGSYRLEHDDAAGYFDHVVGPQSLKRFLYPPGETLLESVRTNGQWQMKAPTIEPKPIAVIGLRACDLHALAIQDKVLLGGPYVDPNYEARRENLFIVAVNCRRAAPTCFCHSMNAGPAVDDGFDLALTEVNRNFVVEIGTPKGAEIMFDIDWLPPARNEIDEAQAVVTNLKAEMESRERRSHGNREAPRQRYLNTSSIHDLLLENLEHHRWTEVARRCLACGNCTMVCPTCFCAAVEEVSDLSGEHVRRERAWDSCFTAEHSYMNTGTVRKSTASRYRQWLTHKLATWQDQFGTSGCVGCGRCITWCPVGIDLTEEVAAIRGSEDSAGAKEARAVLAS